MNTKRKIYFAAAFAPLILVPFIFKGEISSIPEAIAATVVTYGVVVFLYFFFALLVGQKTEPVGLPDGKHNGPDLYLNPNTHDVGVFNDGESVRINNF